MVIDVYLPNNGHMITYPFVVRWKVEDGVVYLYNDDGLVGVVSGNYAVKERT